MRRVIVVVMGAAAVCLPTGNALAHVTVQPNESTVAEFARFVVRVPNERDEAATTKIEVRFPALAFTSFQPKQGWSRRVKMITRDQPLVVFGNEITEVVGSATWSGGQIDPHEFEEFGFSARMPDEPEALVFEAIQTYDDGEVVRWTGEPDSESPAATLQVYDIGAGEGEGPLAVLARMNRQLRAASSNDGSSGIDVGMLLGTAGTVLGAAALGVAVAGRRSRSDAA